LQQVLRTRAVPNHLHQVPADAPLAMNEEFLDPVFKSASLSSRVKLLELTDDATTSALPALLLI
jgi:hypothetical protein